MMRRTFFWCGTAPSWASVVLMTAAYTSQSYLYDYESPITHTPPHGICYIESTKSTFFIKISLIVFHPERWPRWRGKSWRFTARCWGWLRQTVLSIASQRTLERYVCTEGAPVEPSIAVHCFAVCISPGHCRRSRFFSNCFCINISVGVC